MNILMCSLDQSLVAKSGYGDTFERLKIYSGRLKRLDVFVPTTFKGEKWSEANVYIHPVYAKTKLLSYVSLIAAINTHRKHHLIHLMTTNDAVLGALAQAALIGSNTPILLNVFGSYLTNPSRARHSLLDQIRKTSLKKAHHIRTDTYRDKSALIKHLAVDQSVISVEPVPPAPSAQKALLSIAKMRKIGPINQFLTVATLNKNKNIPLLLEAISKLRNSNATFTLIGSGPLGDKITKMIKHLGIQDSIKHHPNLSYDELLKAYQAADAYISTSSHEGFPRVLMEAALSKLPIISTTTSGASEFLTHNTSALLIPKNHPTALIKAIKKVFSNPEFAHNLAKNAHKHARDTLDFKLHTTRIVDIWQTASKKSL